jgi:excisionase family DNA binding protein
VSTPEKLYTSHEVADLFRVHVTTVREWVKGGKIAVIRTPGSNRMRFTESEVRRLAGDFADGSAKSDAWERTGYRPNGGDGA